MEKMHDKKEMSDMGEMKKMMSEMHKMMTDMHGMMKGEKGKGMEANTVMTNAYRGSK